MRILDAIQGITLAVAAIGTGVCVFLLVSLAGCPPAKSAAEIDPLPTQWERFETGMVGYSGHRARTPAGWLVVIGGRPVYVPDERGDWLQPQPEEAR